MKKLISTVLILAFTSTLTFSQSTNCKAAVERLQNYAMQVNQIYNAEYWSVIPNQRCPAYDMWGRPYNPVVVQNCRLNYLMQLNMWYSQQSNYVNNTYATIVNGCMATPPDEIEKPAPVVKRDSEEKEKIDTGKIEELSTDIDESKAVKITIPKTAAGFKSR